MMLKKYRNPYFWLGIETASMVFLIGMFMEGEASRNFTILCGVMYILLSALNLVDIEKAKQKENE